MRGTSVRRALLGAAFVMGAGLAPVAAQAGESLVYHCERIDQYPYRKYECTGAAIEYGMVCAARWADVDSNGDWSGEARVYQVTCTSGLWTYHCTELTYFDYSCTGAGVSPSVNKACVVTWDDDDTDPYYGPTEVTADTCALLDEVTTH